MSMIQALIVCAIMQAHAFNLHVHGLLTLVQWKQHTRIHHNNTLAYTTTTHSHTPHIHNRSYEHICMRRQLVNMCFIFSLRNYFYHFFIILLVVVATNYKHGNYCSRKCSTHTSSIKYDTS